MNPGDLRFPYQVYFYRTAQGSEPVREWLQGLSKEERRTLGEAIQALQMTGPRLSMPYARPLGKGLYELRERVGKVRYRVFYLFDGQKVVVLLHSTKKARRTVEDEIAIARRREQDYFERNKR